jgi:hypothetical protein
MIIAKILIGQNMSIINKIQSLGLNKKINVNKLHQFIKEEHPKFNDASLRWAIFTLTKKGLISKINKTEYLIGQIKEYIQQSLETKRNQVIKTISKKYPDIKAIVFESFVLNEWLNHQVSRYVIFVEVEKPFIKDIFRLLNESFPKQVLLNPNQEMLANYQDHEIVVSPLITQAPIRQKSYAFKIEKLIVDLFTNDLINEFISADEKETIITSIFQEYKVNKKTVYAYAKRRHNLSYIQKLIAPLEVGTKP